ncbi:hypothetical protein JCM11251_002238 [Rhodosporidiobolus azoricus]
MTTSASSTAPTPADQPPPSPTHSSASSTNTAQLLPPSSDKSPSSPLPMPTLDDPRYPHDDHDSVGVPSDWSSPSSGDEDEDSSASEDEEGGFDMLSSREFAPPSEASSTGGAGEERMKLSFPDPLSPPLTHAASPNNASPVQRPTRLEEMVMSDTDTDQEDAEYSLLLDARATSPVQQEKAAPVERVVVVKPLDWTETSTPPPVDSHTADDEENDVGPVTCASPSLSTTSTEEWVRSTSSSVRILPAATSLEVDVESSGVLSPLANSSLASSNATVVPASMAVAAAKAISMHAQESVVTELASTGGQKDSTEEAENNQEFRAEPVALKKDAAASPPSSRRPISAMAASSAHSSPPSGSPAKIVVSAALVALAAALTLSAIGSSNGSGRLPALRVANVFRASTPPPFASVGVEGQQQQLPSTIEVVTVAVVTSVEHAVVTAAPSSLSSPSTSAQYMEIVSTASSASSDSRPAQALSQAERASSVSAQAVASSSSTPPAQEEASQELGVSLFGQTDEDNLHDSQPPPAHNPAHPRRAGHGRNLPPLSGSLGKSCRCGGVERQDGEDEQTMGWKARFRVPKVPRRAMSLPSLGCASVGGRGEKRARKRARRQSVLVEVKDGEARKGEEPRQTLFSVLRQEERAKGRAVFDSLAATTLSDIRSAVIAVSAAVEGQLPRSFSSFLPEDRAYAFSRRLGRRANELASRLARVAPALNLTLPHLAVDLTALDPRLLSRQLDLTSIRTLAAFTVDPSALPSLTRSQKRILRHAHKAAHKFQRALRDESARLSALATSSADAASPIIKEQLEAAQVGVRSLIAQLGVALDPTLANAKKGRKRAEEEAGKALTKAEKHVRRAAKTARWWSDKLGAGGEKGKKRAVRREEKRERRRKDREAARKIVQERLDEVKRKEQLKAGRA